MVQKEEAGKGDVTDMALFGLFSRNRKQPKDQAQETRSPDWEWESLHPYNGMHVEVLNEGGDVLFAAILRVMDYGTGELRRIRKRGLATLESQAALDAAALGIDLEEEEVEEEEPPTEEGEEDKYKEPPVDVTLRGYEEGLRKAIRIGCTMTRTGENTWHLDHLKMKGKDNERTFFRQDIRAVGEVLLLGRDEEEVHACRVTDISAGGLCIRSDEQYVRGDRLQLKVKLRQAGTTLTLLCMVRRAVEKKVDREKFYEYGCQFIEMNEAQEDEVAKAILDIQREQARRQLGA